MPKKKEILLEHWEEDDNGKMIRTDNMPKSFKEKKLEEMCRLGNLRFVDPKFTKEHKHTVAIDGYELQLLKRHLSNTIDATLSEVETQIKRIDDNNKRDTIKRKSVLQIIKELRK